MKPLDGKEVYEHAIEAADFVRTQLRYPLREPAIGVICGSGLGGLADILPASKQFISFADIPHFPQSTVVGHAGRLAIGTYGKSEVSIIMMVGRIHLYEGHSIQTVVFPIRVLKLLGVQTLLVTNAAGGLNRTYSVGDLVLINDHINLPGLSGMHPLRGPNADEFGVRFPPLSDAYDLELRRQAHTAWARLTSRRQRARQLHEGIYAFVSGPSYETRAECRALRAWGADLVGMSTVPEIIVARHCRIRAMALSLVTNISMLEAGPAGNDQSLQTMGSEELKSLDSEGKASHQEVLDEGAKAAQDMQELVEDILRVLTDA